MVSKVPLEKKTMKTASFRPKKVQLDVQLINQQSIIVARERSAVKSSFSTYICYDPVGLLTLNEILFTIHKAKFSWMTNRRDYQGEKQKGTYFLKKLRVYEFGYTKNKA